VGFLEAPAIWFHEIFDSNGRPYKQDEVEFINEDNGDEGPEKAAQMERVRWHDIRVRNELFET